MSAVLATQRRGGTSSVGHELRRGCGQCGNTGNTGGVRGNRQPAGTGTAHLLLCRRCRASTAEQCTAHQNTTHWQNQVNSSQHENTDSLSHGTATSDVKRYHGKAQWPKHGNQGCTGRNTATVLWHGRNKYAVKYHTMLSWPYKMYIRSLWSWPPIYIDSSATRLAFGIDPTGNRTPVNLRENWRDVKIC